MIETSATDSDSIDTTIRVFVFERAAASGTVPQAQDIAQELNLPMEDVGASLKRLAAGKVLILAPNDGEIWAANPFCAVPSGFRVVAEGKAYWAICGWDAMGIVAAVHAESAVVSAPCGDCGDLVELEFQSGELARSEGVLHFAVPAREWWKNIGFA